MKYGYKPLIVTAGFAAVGILWILTSDWILGIMLTSREQTLSYSMIKGIGFIIVTSAALFVLLQRMESSERRARYSETTSQLLELKMPEFFSEIPVIAYVLEIDERGMEPLWISDNIRSILGYTVDQALNRDWWVNNLHPEDRQRALSESRDIIAAGQGNHEYRFRKADGSYANIYDEIKRTHNSGEARRFIGIWNDISKEYRAEQAIEDYAARLQESLIGTIDAVAHMVELRDPYTAGHESRVGDLAVAIAREMGVDSDTCFGLRLAGMVHDIGKISVPSEFLTKPTRLTPAEFAIIQTHPANGYDILREVDFPWPVAEVAYQHHERMNGSGYPRKLKGQQIIPEARILAVADVVESMATDRPYRLSLGLDTALREIENNRGNLYDDDVVAACLRLFHEQDYELTPLAMT